MFKLYISGSNREAFDTAERAGDEATKLYSMGYDLTAFGFSTIFANKPVKHANWFVMHFDGVNKRSGEVRFVGESEEPPQGGKEICKGFARFETSQSQPYTAYLIE
ncbi:hypothetical protein WNY37_03590 [Henriciella sp. AS95]|uniref:hypothetical protein n=1 Tax=Henriciella sp. AS95 TaxID=3135782 RepID=UPI00317596E2